MLCPKCKFEDSKVVDSRPLNTDSSIRRRRECLSCNFRFTTYEYIQLNPVMVIKKTGSREEYSRKKIEKSLHLACNKRPVSEEVIQKMTNDIEEQINNASNIEVNSSFIGELIIEKLRGVDKVAFIRFASVYREFHDIGEFQAQLDDLKNK
tara:strand:- start:784 stop:1236 length:453 start_codon:yes stop_codon:yes gene_type:complete